VDDAGVPTTALIVMPWLNFRYMSTYDIKSIYAYLKLIPPINNPLVTTDQKPANPPQPLPTTYTEGNQTSPVPLPSETDPLGNPLPDPGNVLKGLAIVPLAGVTAPSDPTQLALFGRGAYLVNAVADCSGCHTNIDNLINGNFDTASYLTGGFVFPIPPNLQALIGVVRSASADLQGSTHGFFNKPGVDFETFLTVLSQGIHAEAIPTDGGAVRPIVPPMPWNVFHNMELSDIQAVYTYMSQVAAYTKTAYTTPTADKVIPAPALYCDGSKTPAGCAAGYTCSSSTGPGECTGNACTVATDCAVCQTCTAGGTCAVETGQALGQCVGVGY
jgi:hypothetical protein